MKEGWAKVPQAAEYAGVKPRTFRELLKQGLPHIKLPSGTTLTRFSDIDKFYSQFSVNDNQIDRIVDEVLR